MDTHNERVKERLVSSTRDVFTGRYEETHGHFRGNKPSLTYASWDAMVMRCVNPKNIGYAHYGGRGVLVCERWRKFENFLEDMGERPSKEHQLEREDNDGNYEPGNCRWATRKEQARNRRSNLRLTLNGVTRTAVEWSEELGVSLNTIAKRKSRGWSDTDALRTDCSKKRRVL